jgi:basic membrane protein A
MIDGGRDGVSQVCRETELRQIGNVLDWVERDPAVFVASALADSGLGVVQAIQDFQDGRFAPGSKKTYGLEFEQSVSLVMSPPLSAAHGQAIAQWRSQLISGQLHPDETYEGPELSLAA